MVSLDAPLPADWIVDRGLDAYLAENGFSRAVYDDPTTQASLFGISFRIPNTPKHRWAIMLHDLHHVATGYGTDLAGEAEISNWEAAAGMNGLGLYVGFIVGGLALLGVTRWPGRMRAARAASRGRSLFQSIIPYDEARSMTIGELRAKLGIPERGLAGPRALHALAPRPSDQKVP